MIRILSLVFLLFACKKAHIEQGSEPFNNGPVADLASPQARATGQLVFQLHPKLLKKLWSSRSKKIDPKCESQNNIDGSNLEECGYTFACSGALVQEPSFAEKFVVFSAAHCNLNQAYEGLVNFVSDQMSEGEKKDIAREKMSSTFQKNFQGKARLWFFVPATKQWMEIERFIPHPSFVDLQSAREPSFDVAIASLTKASIEKVKYWVSVDTSVSLIQPSDPKVTEKLYELQLHSNKAIEGKWPFISEEFVKEYGFSLSLFNHSPEAQVFGFGALNAFSMAKEVKNISENQCRTHEEYFYLAREKRCFQFDQTIVENKLSPLRSVQLRMATVIPENFNMLLLPSESRPKEGVCFGDSGGPVFRQGSSQVFAVVSGGELPCSGGVSMMTLIAPHLSELGYALAHPRE